MLVVAPTSSGKTMVSYYVMQTVHANNLNPKADKDKETKSSKRKIANTSSESKESQESDHGVVVYVCPTKALVNQVCELAVAEIKDGMGCKFA